MSQLDIILEKAYSLKGSHSYDNYCQRFVRVCYEAAGITGEAASANDACAKWLISTDMGSVPAGAAVYFKGVGSYGHVGIATGGGNIIHAANGVRVQSLDYCDKKYVFKGWGWQGGKRPEGAKGRATAAKQDTQGNTKKSSKTIEQIVEKSLGGSYGGSIFGSIESVGNIEKGYELLIENDRVYLPAIAGEVVLEYKRTLTPGMLKFNVLKDESIDFQEGSPVRFRVGGADVFRGYVFEKNRKERDVISVTAYDSLRYLKNKDTILYRGKSYSALLKMLIKDYRLKEGDICDTGYVIEKQLEEGTLFDILANAADITYLRTGKTYTLLDDFGKICLRDTNAMTTELVFDSSNTGSFDYTSTIDREVYDCVRVAADNESGGIREVYTAFDPNTQRWGRLQCYLRPKEEFTPAQIKELADGYLKRYARKRRYLSLYDMRGDISVRGGSVIRVSLDLGDIVIDEKMRCERVRHRFYGAHHLMDADLYGREGEFDV